MLIRVVLFNYIRKAIALPPTSQTAIAPPQPPKQRSHPLNFPNSDRIPPTPQTAIPTERFAIASLQLLNSDRTPSTPKQRSHPSNFPNSDRTPQLPNSDRTPSTSPNSDRTPSTPKQRSHPSNFPNSDRTPSNPQTAIAPLQLPKHPFLTNHRDTEDTEKERLHSLNFPTSFFNEPRRHEESEGRREEENTLSNFIYSLRRCKFI
ncbi:MAG: hypothetical protein PT118_15425 [Aphanizomenon gracile PMC644.10]|nr:hypothetical protein [Aphanizomenon gracile PMC644.10]